MMCPCRRARCWDGSRNARSPGGRSAWRSSAAACSARSTWRRRGARLASTSSASPTSRPTPCASGCLRAGWPDAALQARERGGCAQARHDVADRRCRGADRRSRGVEVVIEATGDAPAGVEHALLAIAAGRHVVMVNVEADALVGPLLARRAEAAGVVYTLAYGDQPALICELVEWARLSGFEVVCAGKGTKHLPAYHEVTPDSVWEHYGLPPEQTSRASTRRCSAPSSTAPSRPSRWPRSRMRPASCRRRAASASRPAAPESSRRSCGRRTEGGVLDRSGTLEVVSSLHTDGSPVPGDLRWGVYVTIAAADRFVAARVRRLRPRDVRRWPRRCALAAVHLVGLELGVSVARAVIAGEPTGMPAGGDRRGRVSCQARPARRRDDRRRGRRARLRRAAGRVPAAAEHALPMGLARGVRLRAGRRARRARCRTRTSNSRQGAPRQRCTRELARELQAPPVQT